MPKVSNYARTRIKLHTFIDQQMRSNDEMTSAQIQKLAKRGVTVSSSTVRRSRKQQGWTLQQTAYGQLIRDANKVKRLEYAQRIMESDNKVIQKQNHSFILIIKM